MMPIFSRLSRSEIIHGRAAMFVMGIWVLKTLIVGWAMQNPIKSIKTWFFELIEDAVGAKAMRKFNAEEGKKEQSKNQNKE